MEKVISFDWCGVSTEISLAVFAVLTILLAALFPKRGDGAVKLFAVFGILFSMCVEIAADYFWQANVSFGGLLSGFDSAFSLFAMICTLLSAMMISKESKHRSEFAAILMICCAGLILFVRAQNLLLAFVALECATICLYILTAWNRNVSASLEGAVRYLIAGGASGAILLMGLALLYGAGFSYGTSFLDFANFKLGAASPLFWTGLIFVCAGVLFKMAAFPFQFWAPDVYQGAPTPVSAFLAVVSKAAGVVFLVNICTTLSAFTFELTALNDKLVFGVSIVAALTILVGNLGGITQINAKRLMAFSGISNAGYLLVVVAAILRLQMSEMIEFTIYFYLIAYMFANYSIFFAINGFEGESQHEISLGDFRGMLKKSTATAGSLIVNLASLSGIPPTAGFFGKILILLLAWYAELYWLMGVMIFGSVVSVYYYFSWIRAAIEPEKGDEHVFSISDSRATTMVALSVCTVLFGFALLYLAKL